MKLTLLSTLFCLTLGFLGRPAVAQSIAHPDLISASAAEKAKAAIKALLKRNDEAWNRHDMDAWAESLHTDVDWVHWRGKAAVNAGHEEIHRTFYKSTKVTPNRIEHLAFIAPDLMVVHARNEMSGDERSPVEVFNIPEDYLVHQAEWMWNISAI